MPGAPSYLGAPITTPGGAADNVAINKAEADAAYMSKTTPKLPEGTDKPMGAVALVAGSKVVNNSKITANSRIQLTSQVDGGTPGFLRVSARAPGTSFTITSSSGTDTSTVAYEIKEPDA